MSQIVNTYSTRRLTQTGWFVTSAYFAFMIAETTKDGLLPAFYGEAIAWPQTLLAIATLIVYFISAAEGYLWLNPKTDKSISSTYAIFRGSLLIIYLISVIVQAFLYHPFQSAINEKSLIFWCRSFGALLVVYSTYNIILFAQRVMVDKKIIHEEEDDDVYPLKDIILFIAHYVYFAAAFLLYALIISIRTDLELFYHIKVIIFLFCCYFYSYFEIWWERWHQKALEF